MTTTFFSFVDAATHIQELKAYFEENAKDYFDGFEVSEDGNTLTMTTGGKAAFDFQMTTENSYDVCYPHCYNGQGGKSDARFGSGIWRTYVRKIIKTANGFAIGMNYGGSDKACTFFISKDNNGNTAFVYCPLVDFNSDSVSSYNSYFYATSTAGHINSMPAIVYYGKNENFCFISAGYTAFVNVPIRGYGLTYFPHVFVTPYSSLLGTECDIEHDGKHYYYNGYIALED